MNASTTHGALAKTIGTKPEFIPRRRSDVDASLRWSTFASTRIEPGHRISSPRFTDLYHLQEAGGATAAELGDLHGFRLIELPFGGPPRAEVERVFATGGSNLAAWLGMTRIDPARADLPTPNATAGCSAKQGSCRSDSGAVVRHPA